MVEPNSAESLFKLDLARHAGWPTRLAAVLEPPISRLLCIPQISRTYEMATAAGPAEPFADRVLQVLNIGTELTHGELSRIPASGPVVVVANHPFGAVEGLILLSLLRRVRPDVRVMANLLLGRLPELRDSMIFVDPFGGAGSRQTNRRPMRECLAWLESGGLLAMFPAGEVAHLDVAKRAVVDPPWAEMVARLVRKTGAAAVPIFIEGRNGVVFQLAGMVHPRLRTLMLPFELFNKSRTRVRLRVGRAIPHARLAEFGSDADLTAYLRLRTYVLGSALRRGASDDARRLAAAPISDAARPPDMAPIISPVPPDLLQRDIAALPADSLLLRSRELEVWVAPAARLPHVLREIGRLREITFRAASEGTGRSIDLDRFDECYQHLFLWNATSREIVGGYRLGLTGDIVPAHGVTGLYTATLFRIDRRLIDQIAPAIELGRSFIRAEYQRAHAPLGLMWKGIGRFVVRHPRYRMLFGPVSINAQYETVSQRMIIDFLQATSYLPALARWIKPRNPPRWPRRSAAELRINSRTARDIDDVSTLVSEIEADAKGVPILLRQYLKLGAKLLGFNVDPDFGQVLDALVLVDLTQTPRRLLDHYLERDGASAFLQTHGA